MRADENGTLRVCGNKNELDYAHPIDAAAEFDVLARATIPRFDASSDHFFLVSTARNRNWKRSGEFGKFGRDQIGETVWARWGKPDYLGTGGWLELGGTAGDSALTSSSGGYCYASSNVGAPNTGNWAG